MPAANANTSRISDSPQDVLCRHELDIGIVSTGDDEAMQRSLPSVARSVGSVAARLVLVDNASRGGVDAWTEYFDSAIVLRNRRRARYAETANQLLAGGLSPYLLLVDAGVYFDPEEECVAKLVQFMEDNADCGIAGCRRIEASAIVGSSGRRRRRRDPLAGFPSRFDASDSFRSQFARGTRDVTATFDCGWLSGPMLIVRRCAMQEDVGGFETAFSRDFAQVDVCLRMALAGWRVVYHGQTYCHNFAQAAVDGILGSGETSWRRMWSAVRFMQKWGVNPRRHLERLASNARGSRDSAALAVLQRLGGMGYPEPVDEGLFG